MVYICCVCPDTHQEIVIVAEVKSPDGLHMRLIVVSILGPLIDLIDECQHDRESVPELLQACEKQVLKSPGPADRSVYTHRSVLISVVYRELLSLELVIRDDIDHVPEPHSPL